MPSCLIEDVARTLDDIELPLDQEALRDSREVMTLVDALTLVDDPRRRQGRRYRLTGLLAVVIVAVLGGARSPAAIVRWARGADAQLLDVLGLPHGTDGAVPAATTWGRALARTDGNQLDDALTLFTETLATDPLQDLVDTGPRSLAADGKTVCGAVDADSKQLHLLSVFRPDTGTVAAQRAMRDKGCEATHFSATLDTLDSIQQLIITADALHCQREHARYLHERGAFYYFPVLGNQPTLFAAPDGLDWDNTPIGHTQTERNKGRTETRELKVLPVPDHVDFPHAKQAVLIERTTTDRRQRVTIHPSPRIPRLQPGEQSKHSFVAHRVGHTLALHAPGMTTWDMVSALEGGGAPPTAVPAGVPAARSRRVPRQCS